MPSAFINLPSSGSPFWKDAVATAGSLPLVGNTIGEARVSKDTGIIYVWTGATWTSPSGSGTVTSVGLSLPGSILSVSGSPVTGAGTLTGTLVAQTANTAFLGPASGPAAAPTFRALDPADLPLGSINTVAVYNNAGALVSSPTLGIDALLGGVTQALVIEPNNTVAGFSINQQNINFEPLQNSPDDSYILNQVNVQLDAASSGFSMGTIGQGVTLNNLGITHSGSGDVGPLTAFNTNFQIGNGIDAFSAKGFAASVTGANIAANVTLNGPMQGYIFQPSVNGSAILDPAAYFQGFADNSNIQSPMAAGYTSFQSGANIASIPNNNGFVGYNANAQVTTLLGNAGYTSFSAAPQIGTINDGSYQGLSIQPTVTLNKGSAIGVNVSMSNVTNYAGVASTLTIQDLTFTFTAAGDNNSVTIEYTNTATAGNETVNVAYPVITIGIQSGVSTATQVKTACDNTPGFASSVTTTISGVGSNPQVTQAPTNFINGINPGTKKAAQFDGDVSINGALSFTGALSIGELDSFATYTVTSGLGVASIDTLITSPSVPASATITGTDLLSINTAMLLNIGNNASVTSSFLGYAALGLPAVLSMGTGSTIDLVEGAVFAISLDGAATGGTAAEVNLCRALAIPNGITTVTDLKGYAFDLPFGDVGTTQWGFYSEPASAHNYFAGDVIVGDTDVPTNSSVGIELDSTTKAILLSRLTTTQKNALTAVAGMACFDTTLNQLSYYNGTVWVNV